MQSGKDSKNSSSLLSVNTLIPKKKFKKRRIYFFYKKGLPFGVGTKFTHRIDPGSLTKSKTKVPDFEPLKRTKKVPIG